MLGTDCKLVILYLAVSLSLHTRRDSEQQVLGFQTTKELLYGGFWQKEHSSTPPPSPSSPSSQPTKSHMFSFTLLLDTSVSRFPSLVHCVSAIRGVWPPQVEATPLDSRANFIKHFYYEVIITSLIVNSFVTVTKNRNTYVSECFYGDNCVGKWFLDSSEISPHPFLCEPQGWAEMDFSRLINSMLPLSWLIVSHGTLSSLA